MNESINPSTVFSDEALLWVTVQKSKQINTCQIVGLFLRRWKNSEYLEGNLLKQGREPTNKTHVCHQVWESKSRQPHWWGARARARALSTAPSVLQGPFKGATSYGLALISARLEIVTFCLQILILNWKRQNWIVFTSQL